MAESRVIACPECGSLNRVPTSRPAQEGKCGRCGQRLFTGKPLRLSASRFEVHATKSEIPLFVDFWASWCGPCRVMAPTFEALARECEPRFRFGKIDVDAEPGLANRFQVRSIPTLILFNGGREVARAVGALPGSELRRWLDQHVPSIS